MRNEFDITDGHQPTHALFYIKKGSFQIEFDGVNEVINPGDCLIIPDYLHFRRHVLDPIEFVYLKFKNDLNCPYSFDIPYGKVTFKDKKRFISNISNLEQLIACDDLLSANYREHLLTDILFQFYFEQHEHNIASREQTIKEHIVESAVEYIEENIGRKILIQDICKRVGTNTSTLNFKFRRAFNMSVGQFIMNDRMKKARHLLIGTTYSISEIATRCGFDNVYYFSNTFKKMHGISPTDYRNYYA